MPPGAAGGGAGQAMSEPIPPPPDSASDPAEDVLAGYRPWLHLLARIQIGSRFQGKFDVSDVVQQAMLEAVKAWPQFRGRTGAERAAWLRKILAHALAHEVRRYAGTDKRDVGREVSLEDALEASSRRLGQTLAAPGSSPSVQADRHETELRLAAALERMPEDYRTVIVLRNLDGLSHEDVASRMGRGVGAVRMLWVRALTRLRQELDVPGSSSGP
jgi:RNA polymerase sigma-70 factor, ECF subfamily